MPARRTTSASNLGSKPSKKSAKPAREQSKRPREEEDTTLHFKKSKPNHKSHKKTSPQRSTAKLPSKPIISSPSRRSESSSQSSQDTEAEFENQTEAVEQKRKKTTGHITVFTSTFEIFGHPPSTNNAHIDFFAADSTSTDVKPTYPLYGMYTPADHPSHPSQPSTSLFSPAKLTYTIDTPRKRLTVTKEHGPSFLRRSTR